MKRYLAIVLLGLYSLVGAQTVQTTPNLITSGTTHTWYGVQTGTLPGNYMPGGPTPLYDPSTNTITFSYGSASVGQTYAVNQALASVGAGVKVNGYTYSYDVRNMNGDDRQPGIDTFTVSQLLRGPQNSVLLSSNQYYNTKFEWKTVTGTKTATTPYNIADTSYIQFGVSGADNGYWGGYFGPQIRNVDMRLNYTVDPCVANPLSSPSCAGYNNIVNSQNIAAQTYAINQALNLSGSGVQINGFKYGYDYYVGGDWCVSSFLGFCTNWDASSMAIDVNVTSNTGASLYSQSHNHTTQNTGGSVSYSYVFPTQRSLSSMGTFTLSTREYGSTALYSSWSNWQYTPDPCTVDPLSSQSCPGYTAAYLTQQCNANPLYSTSCPGYAQAIFTQQCNANQLSNPTCPGYAAAYLTQQCNANPLYSTTCPGYETAYFNQQCSADPLYNSQCTGYAQAYHDQQCSINALYASDCTGYAQAYKTQQCSANALYASDCPGYDQAYLNQQCLANSLYSTQCEGYKTAYAIKYLVGLDSSVTTAVNSSLTNTVEVQRNDPTNVTGTVDPVASATGSTSSSSTQASATSSPTSISPVAVISTVRPAPAPMQQMAQAEPKKDNSSSEKKDGNTASGPSNDSKPADKPKSNREALAERRAEAAKKEAVAKAKDLANEMGKASNLEAQQAVQNVVIQAMGFTPGFDTYNKSVLPDASIFYKPYQVYGGQVNVDNRNVSRRLMGGSDETHQKMVDSQFNLGK